MGDVPTFGQLGLLVAALAVFVTGGEAAILRARQTADANHVGKIERLRLTSKISLYLGIFLGLCVLVWHGIARGDWNCCGDNFGAFVSLGLLLAGFVLYTQRAQPLRGLEFFVMPVVLLLLVLAAVFGRTKPHAYHETTWAIVHRMTAYGGFLGFAVAGAVGGMYLLASRRLRQKKLMPGQGFGSLERMEHITWVAVTLGFALLTVGLVTGFFKIMQPGERYALGPLWYRNSKVLLASITWVVYALVLHAPINPAFRGQRTAQLSVLGLILMLGIFAVVQFMPSGS